MRARLILAALAAVAALAVPAAETGAQQRRAVRPTAARPAPARDWTRVAVRTPDGVRIGNPAAPVKLVEYGSITCPHCAAFANEGGTAGLYAHVRTGRVSWEYRPYMIFPTDPGLFAALNCLAPGQFFGAVDQLYRTQRTWASAAQAYVEAHRNELVAMDIPHRAVALFGASQLQGLFTARGLAPAALNACISSPANLERVAANRRRADSQGVQGTPTFLINGVQTAPLEYFNQLEPLLIQAGARR